MSPQPDDQLPFSLSQRSHGHKRQFWHQSRKSETLKNVKTLFVSKIVLWNTLPENLSCQCPVLYLLYWRPHPASKIRVVEGGSRGCCLPPNELCLLLGNPEISKQPKTFTSQKVIAFYNLVVKFILQCFNRKLWVIIRLASMHQVTLQEYVLLFILPF